MPTTEIIPDFSGIHEAVPEHLRDGLWHYVREGRPTGHFLECVLSNDLAGAMGRADEESRGGLYAVVRWLYNEAPSNCWGTPERVKAWLTNAAKAREAVR
jgi:hypothetical protein